MYDTMKRKWIVALCAAALAGCSKEPAEPVGPAAGTVPIELSAATQSGVETKAAVEGSKFPEMTPAFYLTATQGTGETAPTDWRSPYFSDKPVNSASDGTLSWPEGQKQYYPADKTKKLYFYAYTPEPSSVTAGTQTDAPRAEYTIDGGQDIMWAANTQGIKPDGAVAAPVQLNFAHKLMQVRFKVAKDEAFQLGEGETFAVTSIKIRDVRTSATLDLGTGSLTFPEAAPKGTLTAYEEQTGIALGDDAAEVPGSVLFEPQTSFTCEVAAGGNTYPDVRVTLSGEGAGQAGVNHLVALTFKQEAIKATATIAPWADGGEGTTGEDAYPLVVDGHTIVIRDLSGQADLQEYPIHNEWLNTPAHSEEDWISNTSNYNTFSASFEVAMEDAGHMTWNEATTACASYGQQSKGAGTWRLPTIREMKLIVDRQIDLYASMPQGENRYWSATEGRSDHMNDAWSVATDGTDPRTDSQADTYAVRCVRDLATVVWVPQYPYVRDGAVIVVSDPSGQADLQQYPLHRNWRLTPDHSEANWFSNESNWNRVSAAFEVASEDAGQQTDWSDSPCFRYEQSPESVYPWRMPTIREMKLIMDMQSDLYGIEPLAGNRYWSATKCAENPGEHVWSVATHGSAPESTPKTNLYNIRCIRDL